MPKCCYCGGRGWVWVGIASNAERVSCDACEGKGRWRRPNMDTIIAILLLVMSLGIAVGIIHFSLSFAYGGTAGAMTLKEFRQLPGTTKSAMVAGAMATTEYVGLACPDPQKTVAEYVSALTWRKLDDGKPWIEFYFRLTDEHGCRVEESGDGVTPKEGA